MISSLAQGDSGIPNLGKNLMQLDSMIGQLSRLSHQLKKNLQQVSASSSGHSVSANHPSIEQIKQAVQKVPEIADGAGKVWICDVAEALGTTKDKLAPVLVDANQQGKIKLARCDAPTLFDPEKQKESEISYLNATFHFIRK
jgi:hypothetical protein